MFASYSKLEFIVQLDKCDHHGYKVLKIDEIKSWLLKLEGDKEKENLRFLWRIGPVLYFIES